MPEPNSGCLLWLQYVDNWGYGRGTYLGIPLAAHRFSWLTHRGSIPDGMKVCHRCDVPSCINPDHLWLGTDSDNAADRNAKGRQSRGARHVAAFMSDRWMEARPRGARHGNAKLTEQDIREIRSRGGLQREIAAEFGISQRTVSQIRRLEVWKHV